MATKRHADLDRLKGVAIFLVVLGHVVSREPPQNAQWYMYLKDSIYLFHMPLFMFISGLILAYARKPMVTLQDYGKYLQSKFIRLIPAYLGFSAIIFIGKAACGQVMHVDNPVVTAGDFFNVLLNPHSSYCAYLWYIYVLFLFYLLAPLAYRLTGNRIQLLLPFCIVAYFLNVTPYFALSSVAEYSLVFTLGCLAGEHYQRYSSLLDRYGALFVAPFLVALAFAVPWGVPKLLLGLLSIPACHAMVRMDAADFLGVFKTLGKYTFPIYLMNTAFIGLSKGVMFQFASWDGVNFFWFAPTLLAAGIVGPILVKRVVIARSQFLNTIVA